MDPIGAELAHVGSEIDRSGTSRVLWQKVALIAIAGFFEQYELFSTPFVLPGLVKSGLVTTSATSVFSPHGAAFFIASMYVGVFFGAVVLARTADWIGRRSVLIASLVAYAVSSLITAVQLGIWGINAWRLVTGIGLGVTMVTINIYISEIVPRHLRGRASAFSLSVQCTAIPVAALIAWRLVPMEPFGVSGWRWVVGLGGLGVIPAWVIYARLAESPRWMVAKGKSLFEDGSPIFGSETRRKGPANARDRVSGRREQFAELFHRRYIRRVVMFSLFHATHTIGIYGFIQWGPSFLVSRGIPLAHSLAYSLFGAAVLPIDPVIALTFADRWERKWQIFACLAAIAVTGLMYANPVTLYPSSYPPLFLTFLPRFPSLTIMPIKWKYFRRTYVRWR